MARPRKYIHEQAVGAALEHFWRTGYFSTNVSELAECMGISRSSFYNSFIDRESLFLEVLSAYADQAPDAALDAIEPGQPVLPAIRAVLYNLCVARSDPDSPKGCLAVNAIAEVGGDEPKVSTVLNAMLDTKFATLQRLYRQAKRQGEIRGDVNEKLLADETVVFINGLNLVANLLQDRTRLWAMTRDFMLRLGFPEDVVVGKAAGK